MPLRISYITLFAVLFISLSGYCSDSVNVAIKCATCEARFTKEIPHGEVSFFEAEKIISRTLRQLRLSGYFEAGADTLDVGVNCIQISIAPGARYEWEKLTLTNFPRQVMAAQRFENLSLSGDFNAESIRNLADAALTYAENSGFPFASLRFDSAAIDEEKISAALVYQEGPYIVFDSLKASPSDQFRGSFIGAYLGIFPGAPFDQRLVDQVDKKLSGLPYLRLTKRELSFQNQEATVSLDLEPVKANQFEGFAGLSQEGDNGMQLTGQIDLSLQNLFKSGKWAAFQWRKLRPASQLLDVRYHHPRLFASPFDFALQINLMKEDSSFLNRSISLSLSYNLNSRIAVSFLTDRRFSNSVSESGGEDFPNMKWSTYGAGFRFNNLGDYFHPRDGQLFFIKGLVGNKTYSDPAYSNQKGLQYSVEGGVEWYFPLLSRVTIVHKVEGGFIGGGSLFPGDLFRLGGMKSLRGFEENEFFADLYAASKLEGRYFLEEKSYIMAFYDQGFARMPGVRNFPAGIGAGIALNVKSGFLTLAYAAGWQEGRSLSFNHSKLHVGFETIF